MTPEMDKARDVRRGATRFLPAKRQIKLLSGLEGNGDGGDVLFKAKKDRVRRLSVVGKASSSCEMVCLGSYGEDEPPSQTPSPSCNSKKFKVPKRVFDDCNSVDHSSVPRKLRTAMKKRSRESISPPFQGLKKPNSTTNGVECPKKDGVKKSKLKQGSLDCSPRPITKDEEEVAETLYALAGMFPDNDTTNKSKLECESSGAKPLASPENGKIHPAAASEVSKDKSESIPSTNAEGSGPEKTAKVLLEPKLADRKHLNMELDSSVPCMNLQTMPLLPKSKKPELLHNSASFVAPPELSPEIGLKEPKQQETPHFQRKPENALGMTSNVGSQQEPTHTIKESKKNEGPALWPGLSSAGSNGIGIHGQGSSLQSSPAKIQSWLDTASCAVNGVSNEKKSEVVVNKKSRKRCAAHVYISRLIQELKSKERSERLPIQSYQSGSHEGLNQGVIMVANIPNRLKVGLNEYLSAGIRSGVVAEKISNGTRNDFVLPNRLHQNQQESALASGRYTLQNQTFDFLSLSAGRVETNGSSSSTTTRAGNGLEQFSQLPTTRAGNGLEQLSQLPTTRAGNGLEQFSQLPAPYLHSLAQYNMPMPFSLPQSRYSSSAYSDQLSSAAAAQQLPSYLSNPFGGPSHMNTPAPTKQQQQPNWTAQYRPGGTSSSSIPQFPSWQSGRQEVPSLSHCSQSILPPSPSSLEVLGPKYIPISQQQQQFMAFTSSLPPTRGNKRQHHNIPSGYEDNGKLPLQLLCNERI